MILLAVAACATSDIALDIRPGYRPAANTDEAGLWMHMDRVEVQMRTSGRLLTDPDLTAYVRNLVCKLAAQHCNDVRVYVVQTPHFNASMAPNGSMQVWTGLLLRVENEAQLAYILGHELGHYLKRHSLKRWRVVRTSSDALVFFRVLTAAAGVGFVGDLASLAAAGGIFAFSRDNEREADDIGFELIVRNGYDPREAARIWESLSEERKAGDESRPLIFFSTHPPSEERAATLRQRGQNAYIADRPWVTGKNEFHVAIRNVRRSLLADELQRRDPKRTEVLLARLFEQWPNTGDILFFQGEVFRIRGATDDDERAMAYYQRAVDTGTAPPEAHRSLGLILMKRGDRTGAWSALQQYLNEKPNADDRPMIEKHLSEIDR